MPLSRAMTSVSFGDRSPASRVHRVGLCTLATTALILLVPLGRASAQECAADADCGAGYFCRDGECTNSCEGVGTPCPGGYVCDGEWCVACAADADCIPQATEHTDCPQCQYCDEGNCEVGCDDALNPCDEGLMCAEHECVQCRADGDCTAGLVCAGGDCVECRDQSQCAEGQFCVARSCRACRNDTDCQGGTVCLLGECLDCSADAASQPQCQAVDCSDGAFETVYFEWDQSIISTEQEIHALRNAWCMRQHPDREVLITGHTDERGSDGYNFARGERMARSLRTYLVGQGISDDRIDTISMGESQPICREHEEACWSQNRRAEVEWR